MLAVLLTWVVIFEIINRPTIRNFKRWERPLKQEAASQVLIINYLRSVFKTNVEYEQKPMREQRMLMYVMKLMTRVKND